MAGGRGCGTLDSRSQMRHRNQCLILALALSGVAASNASGGTLTFTFSFTNSIGNTPGAVTGRVVGLGDNATGPATAVLIDSYPLAFDPTPFSLPIDATVFPNQFLNTFTVASGSITSAQFDATSQFRSTPPSQYVLNFTTTFGQFFDTTNVPTCCSLRLNTSGPISFAQASAVPEPASFGLVVAGGWVAWLIRRRTIRQQ